MSTEGINKTVILSTRGWRREDSGDARFYRAVNKALLYIRVLQVLQISLETERASHLAVLTRAKSNENKPWQASH